MGSSFAALYEGISPDNTPTIRLIKMDINDSHIGNVDGNILLIK